MMMMIYILLQELNQDREICATDDYFSYTIFACPHMNPKTSITTPSSGVYYKILNFHNRERLQLRSSKDLGLSCVAHLNVEIVSNKKTSHQRRR
jgi:hypothetical protein